MVKKILTIFVLIFFISNCFAGYSSGGRSGYSGGNRSYSSKSFSSSRSGYSSGRSGYSRSTNTVRSYSAPRTYATPRSYSGSSSNTVIHNNHYSHGGFGGGFGGGFFSGMLGGYLGGSLANNHNQVVVAGAAPVVGEPMVQGQGMLMEGSSGYVSSGHNGFMNFVMVIGVFLVLFIGICMIFSFVNREDHCNHKHNRW